MRNEQDSKQYGLRFRIFAAILTILIVIGNIYVVYLQQSLPYDYRVHMAAMALCSVLLVHIGIHIAATGNRPGYMKTESKADGKE